MDTALYLRQAVEAKSILDDQEIDCLLISSEILKRIFQAEISPANPILSYLFKLVACAEIPFSERCSETQEILTYISQHAATPQGFAYTGRVRDIVPCYNAMALEAYCQLGLADSEEAQHALDWIKNYQIFARNETTTWSEDGICQHGGCLRQTPCYIGIGKSMRALIAYDEQVSGADKVVKTLISKGIAYMLQHHMFLRLSEDKPISQHITENVLPQNYFLSMTDLLNILGKTGKVADPRATKLLDVYTSKKDNLKIEFIYKYAGYTSFENRRVKSEWLNYLYPLWLGDASTKK